MLMQGKTVLITGTQRGIGRAMVDVFAANGADIYAHARKEDSDHLASLALTSERYGVQIYPLFFDMTDSTMMKHAIKQIMADKRPIDALINNAGIILNSLFQMTTEKQLREQFEVNFFSVFLFTQYISKLMVRNKRGSIVNVSSTVGEDGNSGKSAYGASKAALIAITKAIAEELGPVGIRANCIAPGITETDMLCSLPEHILEQAKSEIDMRRPGLPTEVAEAALFLASDLASYVTGQVIRVDGGSR